MEQVWDAQLAQCRLAGILIQFMNKTGNAAQDAGTLVHFVVLLHLIESLCFIFVRVAGSGHVPYQNDRSHDL